MSPSLALRLAALGGRVDRLRFAVTMLGAMLSTAIGLTAAVVISIPEGNAYRVEVLNEQGLRGGAAFALVLLSIPALVLTALGARVGSPARDRRLGSLRLAGVTPGEASRVVAIETGLAALAGSLAAVVVLGVVRWRGSHPATYRATVATAEGGVREVIVPLQPTLPVDVTPHGWAAVLAILVVPVGAVALNHWALRRVRLTPFGVVRRERPRPPALGPAAAVVLGAAGFASWPGLARALDLQVSRSAVSWVLLGLALLVVVGLVLGTASIASIVGRLVAVRARSAAVLIAGRRLEADPWSTSRATSSIVLALLAGSGAAAFTAEANLARPDTSFFANTYVVIRLLVVAAGVLAALGLLVAQLETTMVRRRSLAALVAAGVPRGVLRRAAVLEALLPLVPVVLLSLAVGTLAARLQSGGGTLTVSNDPSGDLGPGTHQVPIPVAWADLSGYAIGSLLLVLAVVLVGLVRMGASTTSEELRTPS